MWIVDKIAHKGVWSPELQLKVTPLKGTGIELMQPEELPFPNMGTFLSEGPAGAYENPEEGSLVLWIFYLPGNRIESGTQLILKGSWMGDPESKLSCASIENYLLFLCTGQWSGFWDAKANRILWLPSKLTVHRERAGLLGELRPCGGSERLWEKA